MTTSITAVETFRVDYPVAGQFKFFQQPGGKLSCRPTIVIKLSASDGTVGWGQAVPSPRWSYETPETVETTIEHYLAPLLVGADPFDSEQIHAEMNRAIAPSFSTGQPIAKCGIDLALYDLASRLKVIPSLCEGQAAEQALPFPKCPPGMLASFPLRAPTESGAYFPVPLSWTINLTRLDEVELRVEEATRRGYKSFNIKVAPDLGFDLQLCQLVRKLAPNAFVWADANGGYDKATALAAAKQFADLGLAALEQPLPANRLTGYQRLVRIAALPIAMDEGVVSRVDLEEFCRLKALSGVAIKLARCGGLAEAAAILRLARDEGLLLLGSGLTDPDIALAASIKLFSQFALPTPAALNGPQYLAASILKHPLVVTNGAIAPPLGAGLGVEVDETKLAALITAESLRRE